MTPKEKAAELIHKFIEPAKSYYSDIEWKEKNNKAKQCALIAVDKTLNAILDIHETYEWVKYWEQVKKEIENHKKDNSSCECDNVETFNGWSNEKCIRCIDCGRVW